MVEPGGGVGPNRLDEAAGEAGAEEGLSAPGAQAESRAPYLVSLALQRGPYPYERRTVVVAALDAVTASESHPDEWLKAIKRAHKEGGDVRVVRIALDSEEVASLFERQAAGPRGDLDAIESADRYAVRLALCLDQPPVVVAAVDEEMAVSMGIDLAGALRAMPVFYRRQVSKAYGELREVIVSLPRSAVDAAFDPAPVTAEVVSLLKGDDPRF